MVSISGHREGKCQWRGSENKLTGWLLGRLAGVGVTRDVDLFHDCFFAGNRRWIETSRFASRFDRSFVRFRSLAICYASSTITKPFEAPEWARLFTGCVFRANPIVLRKEAPDALPERNCEGIVRRINSGILLVYGRINERSVQASPESSSRG